MRSEILGLLDKADLAVAACRGVVPEDSLEPAAQVVANARIRLSYPEEVLVVALLGGTGSGKSSLANALTQSEAADVGGLRPTTNRPLAFVPREMEGRLTGYLDSLNVENRFLHDSADWLCVLDMPDTDSVELEHRHQVDSMLPRLDVAIWVIDPEKYRDAALHHRYLTRLAPYAGQFVFVLNQADRLTPDQVGSVVGDFETALTEDGIDAGTVFVTSANPPSSPPTGVDDLKKYLERLVSTRRGLFKKLLVDLEESSSALLESTGGSGLDYRARSSATIDEAAMLIESGMTGKAVDVLKAFAESLAAESEELTRSAIHQLQASFPGRVQTVYEALDALEPDVQKKWIRWSLPPPASTKQRTAEASRLLGEEVDKPLGELLARRAKANAALADLSVSVASVKARS